MASSHPYVKLTESGVFEDRIEPDDVLEVHLNRR